VRCDGITDFDALRSALARRQGRQRRVFIRFRSLAAEGLDLRSHAWTTRNTALRGVLRKTGDGIRLSEHMDGDGDAMFRHACVMGLQGSSRSGGIDRIARAGRRMTHC
jgi:bifunctional non-homologous end joining protein LigD